ncbi:MAG TPA: hypothetical protein VMF69_02015 [Gemmataceae bacterium]|nr:hypothetical protein [Gemmataceae bacterium]
MHSLNNVLVCLLFPLTSAPLVAGETVSNRQLGFRLTVPDGFVEDPEMVQGKVVCAFQRAPTANQKMATFIVVTRLGGVLGREKLDPKEFAPLFPHVTIVTEKWREFDIEVFRVPEAFDLVTFNAQVPLKPEAVQIGVTGEAARENELRGELRYVLGSLEGSTNWLNTNQRVSKLVEAIAVLAGPFGGLLVVIALVVRRVLRKRALTRDPAEPGVTANRPGSEKGH